ncbi:MAG: TraR/DksA family transcriptional regulator [Thermoanaerobaculia bacterium]|nr:TraR/DksA family transcriptional regulator [Thermoanaerobaculia bacterium]
MAGTKTQQKTKQNAAFRKRLEEQRTEILDMYEHDLKVGQRSSDEGAEDLVDRANSAYDREFMLSLSASERDILLEINAALERLDQGSYGVCGQCGEAIPKNRLQAIPWARYCIDCQEQVEQGLMEE